MDHLIFAQVGLLFVTFENTSNYKIDEAVSFQSFPTVSRIKT